MGYGKSLIYQLAVRVAAELSVVYNYKDLFSTEPVVLVVSLLNAFIKDQLWTGRYELNKLTSLPMCGFIAQLVEHCTGIAEVTGSNPVEALIFFSGFFFPIA